MADASKPLQVSSETVMGDLLRMARKYGTEGTGNVRDRAALCIEQAFRTLDERLADAKVTPRNIKRVYFEGLCAASLLPEAARDVAKQYAGGDINARAARERLQDALEVYRDAFRKEGIAPQTIRRIYIRRDKR